MNRQKNTFASLSLFLVYAMFALLALFLVVIGARVYENIVSESGRVHDSRTAMTYIQNKLRNRLDAVGADHDVLVLKKGDLVTYIYEQDGTLCEFYTLDGLPLEDGQGEKIVAVDDFSIRPDNGQLVIRLTDREGFEKVLHVQEVGV